MGCSCQSKNATTGQAKTYQVTSRDGTKSTYKTEVEAAAAARRLQGSYKAA
jgi:hypothetical protein